MNDNRTQSNRAQSNRTHSSEKECNNCGGSSFSLVFDAADFDSGREVFSLARCSDCGLVRTTPLLTDSQLGNYYKSDYYGKGKQKFPALIESWTIYSNLKLAKSIARFVGTKDLAKNRLARILDIGCGRGNLLKAFNQMGFECHGIERTEFPEQAHSASINIHKTALKDANFDDSYFDIIILWHVLEHLSNPVDVTSEIYRILDLTGTLIIAVPNFGSYQSRIFGKHWFHLDLPRHLYHYNLYALENLLKGNNFQIRNVDTRSFDQSIYGFIQSALNCLPWFTPNSFYHQLKLPWKFRKLNFYLQAILAGIILPFSLIDYLVSGLSRNGSCLILNCHKKTDSTK